MLRKLLRRSPHTYRLPSQSMHSRRKSLRHPWHPATILSALAHALGQHQGESVRRKLPTYELAAGRGSYLATPWWTTTCDVRVPYSNSWSLGLCSLKNARKWRSQALLTFWRTCFARHHTPCSPKAKHEANLFADSVDSPGAEHMRMRRMQSLLVCTAQKMQRPACPRPRIPRAVLRHVARQTEQPKRSNK